MNQELKAKKKKKNWKKKSYFYLKNMFKHYLNGSHNDIELHRRNSLN